MKRRCENCGKEMVYLHQQRQRFCARDCSNEWHQQERRQAVEWFRAMGMTVQREGQQIEERG